MRTLQRALIAVLLALLTIAPSAGAEGRATPAPMLAVMHDWQNADWAVERPEWTRPVGAWMYWGWDQVAGDFGAIDAYLAAADAQAKPVAITIMLYEDLGQDSTPASVYARIGRTAGWETIPAGYTYPAWNDPGWDAAYRALILRLGARYDGDPRVHSVWIATGLYGETVTTKAGYTIEGHNFARFVRNSVDWYAEAFPSKPLFLIATGTIDRLALSEYAAERGVGIKQNALAPDLPNHHGLQSVAGLADVFYALPGIPFAYEHFYAPTAAQTHMAMLYGLTHGMRVLDLPVGHLDALAEAGTPWGPLWEYVLQQMDPARAMPLWVARTTEYDCASRDWECGEEGAWSYRATVLSAQGLALLGRSTAGWLAAPEAVRASIYGAYGVGELTGGSIALRLDTSEPIEALAVVYGDVALSAGGRSVAATGDAWQMLALETAGELALSGTGYVHAVLARPMSVFIETPTATPSPVSTGAPTATPLPGGAIGSGAVVTALIICLAVIALILLLELLL